MKQRMPRVVNLHSSFAPDGGPEEDPLSFFEFWLACNERLHALKARNLTRRKRASAGFRQLAKKVGPVFRRMMRDEISPAEAARKIKHLVKDDTQRLQVLDYWADIYRTTPEELEQHKLEIAQAEASQARDGKILAAREAVTRAVAELREMAMAGDEKAAAALVEAASLPGLAVGALEHHQRPMMERIARRETVWPILTDGKPGWERRAADHLAQLNLGADLDAYRARFRHPRGADVNLPARQWARAAARAIEDTRLRYLVFGALLKEFSTQEKLADFMLETGWSLGQAPAWVEDAAKVGAFSTASLPAWKRVIRKLIREQIPGFHERPEWSTQRASALARGRGTPGEVQNAILDDICSALEGLAPPAALPKSDC